MQIKTKAKILERFFKNAKEELYSEGDVFLGIQLSKLRKIAKQYVDISFKNIQSLLSGKICEERFIALIILIEKYKKYETEQKNIFEFYVGNIKNVNRCDLVDLNALDIIEIIFLIKTRNYLI